MCKQIKIRRRTLTTYIKSISYSKDIQYIYIYNCKLFKCKTLNTYVENAIAFECYLKVEKYLGLSNNNITS